MGGIHSARSIMLSVDFQKIDQLMESGGWDEIRDILIKESQTVERAGADFLVICTNTMHKLAPDIRKKIGIPILNIIDVTAEQIKERGFQTIGLLGTRFTMEEDFYRNRMKQEHGLKVLIPDPDEVLAVHRIIVEELAIGEIQDRSKADYWAIMNRLAEKGAQGIILGCTEIPLLVKQEEGDIPVFDTTTIHARAAVDFALGQ
jgi:aspartate racemase